MIRILKGNDTAEQLRQYINETLNPKIDSLDQQNKELREENERLIAEIKRIGYANKGAYESIEQNDKREIARLTKEVEELTNRARHAEKKLLKDTKKVWDDGADKRENTRLRELLGRCKGYLEGFIDKRYLSTGHELLTEIDNALKP